MSNQRSSGATSGPQHHASGRRGASFNPDDCGPTTLIDQFRRFANPAERGEQLAISIPLYLKVLVEAFAHLTGRRFNDACAFLVWKGLESIESIQGVKAILEGYKRLLRSPEAVNELGKFCFSVNARHTVTVKVRPKCDPKIAGRLSILADTLAISHSDLASLCIEASLVQLPEPPQDADAQADMVEELKAFVERAERRASEVRWLIERTARMPRAAAIPVAFSDLLSHGAAGRSE